MADSSTCENCGCVKECPICDDAPEFRNVMHICKKECPICEECEEFVEFTNNARSMARHDLIGLMVGEEEES